MEGGHDVQETERVFRGMGFSVTEGSQERGEPSALFCYDRGMESKKPQGNASAGPTPTAGQASADPEARLRDLEAQVKRLTEIAGRAQADLQNAKARLEKDGEELRKFATAGMMRRLLPTVDNFQRAFLHLPADLAKNEWVKGVAAIEQEFLRQLKDMGLRKMEALGTPLDPSRHEVLLQGPGEAGKIAEVLEEGYEMNGRVLRPAKVKVGDGSGPSEGAGSAGGTPAF